MSYKAEESRLLGCQKLREMVSIKGNRMLFCKLKVFISPYSFLLYASLTQREID